ALAAILIGGITVVVWKQMSGGIYDLYEIVPGFFLAGLGAIIISKLTGGPSESVSKQFEGYEKSLDTMA
ncbi:hypothetical protein ACXWSP_09305, partial [Streptococcus pyogenes]